MGISRAEVMGLGLIDEDVLEYIPSHCEMCGADIEFTDTLKQIYCTNKKCVSKIASRLEYMAKALKVDGWGIETCTKVVKLLGLKSPYTALMLGGNESAVKFLRANSVPDIEKKVRALCLGEGRSAQLWEVVKYGAIPGIETIAFKIFDRFESMEDAFNEIEAGGTELIAEKLGLRDPNGVMVVNVYNTLLEYKEELIFGAKQFNVIVPTGDTLKMAITGGVNGYSSKGEFIRSLNELFRGRYNIVLMNSMTRDTDILIADGDTTSRKYRTAVKMLESGMNVIIADSSEIIDILNKGV